MKTILIVIGVLALLCCGGGAAIFFFGFRAATNVMDEAKSYGDASLNAICKTWDASELERRVAPEVIEQNPEGTLKATIEQLKPLGALGSFKSSVTGVEAKSSTDTGTFTIAKYSAQCEFQNGKGEAELELIKRKEEWRILKFRVQER